jgi:hypothetical protein
VELIAHRYVVCSLFVELIAHRCAVAIVIPVAGSVQSKRRLGLICLSWVGRVCSVVYYIPNHSRGSESKFAATCTTRNEVDHY